MADSGRRNAEILRARIIARIEQIDEEAADLEIQLGNVNAFLDTLSQYEALELGGDADQPQTQLPPVENITSAAKARKRPKNPDRKNVAAMAHTIITMTQRPMSRADLFRALADAGMIIQGRDPEMVLSTMLWRSQDKIVRLKDHGYWTADQPYPEANYHPLVG